MRFALWPNLTQPGADALALARHADATGWDGVYIADHFMGDGGGPLPPWAYPHVAEQRGHPYGLPF
jgi:alkanesulfonate monooxygenase SsuD/methylene tetrahydromethanopterin reductase-like flavin-dependent oxidoreductase (luciferase family)